LLLFREIHYDDIVGDARTVVPEALKLLATFQAMNENPGMLKINRGILTLGLASFITTAIWTTPSFAQSVPGDFAGTIDWLQKNLGGAACAVFEMGATKAELQQVTEGTEVLFSGCDMTLSTSTTVGSQGDVRTIHVPLGKLDPARVTLTAGVQVPAGWITVGEVPSHTMRLVAASDNKIIDVTMEQFGTNAGKPSDYKTSEINIHIRDKDTADKLVTALSRAITFCRQQ
jgi:hypothetical protein